MRITILSICFITLFSGLFAQEKSYEQKRLTTVDLEAFYSFYDQDGNNSAVTGGIGTEKLHVNNFGLNLGLTIDTSHTIIFETFIDIISSASVDNIDFIRSSASEHDNHISAHIGYQYSSKNKPFLLGAKYLFGLESDYLSHGFNLWGSVVSKDQTRELSVSLVCFFDDLRWGRFSEAAGYEPVTLVYPVELRYKQWFDIYRRNSYNLDIGLRQDINKRLSLQFDLGVLFQQGLISTSFHRIFFYDSDSGKVENLPRHRLQFPIGIGLNAFATNSWIVKAYYRYYWDDFGISAHTFSLETPIKLGYRFTLYPFGRLYQQTASTYFKPFGEHSVLDEFYTSDYDLSRFRSYKLGLGIGFFPDKRFGKSRWAFYKLVLRYAYFRRSNKLDAHMISLLFQLGKG